MAFDAGLLRAVMHEIDESCEGGKVERICQPVKDAIDITIHKGRDNIRIYISASSNTPRISITATPRENPTVPPMFCMLLRKHLTGARLLRAETEGFERVARLVFSAYDDMGFACEKTLVFEIMGRFSNIILLDGDQKIISALKTVDFSVSSKRQVLSGMKYELPPAQDKVNPLGLDEHAFFEIFKNAPADLPIEKFITRTFMGVAPSVAREIAFRATGDTEASVGLDIARVAEEMTSWFLSVKLCEMTPVSLYGENGEPLEYSYFDLLHIGADGLGRRRGVQKRVHKSFGEMLDSFFGERELAERMKQRGSDILHIISSAKSRLAKKIDLQTEELADSEKGEEYKKKGDLITANIYMLSRGMEYLECVDYYSDGCPTVRVELNPRLTPSQNAQRMYKLYNKSKNTKKYLTEQIAQARAELSYIESVEMFFKNAQSENDLLEIREELRISGYGKKFKADTSRKSKKNELCEYTTSGGYRLVCGKNNIQNDFITFKLAGKGDLWFHAKGMAGSHVILVCNGEEPSERDYTEAAACAAYYSSADKNSMVEVDYTRVKNIKKPPQAKPGYVIYHTNYSAYVMPALPSGENAKN